MSSSAIVALRQRAAPSAVGLPRSAQAVVASTVFFGAALFSLVARQLPRQPLSFGQAAVAAVIGAIVLAGAARPLVAYTGRHSQAVVLDDGLVLFLLLAVPSSLVVVTFASAQLLAQLVLRRSFVKLAFNVGQVIISVAAASAVFDALGRFGVRFSWMQVLAAIAAAATMHLVSKLLITVLFAGLGIPPRRELLADERFHSPIFLGTVGVALGGAFLLARYPAALPIAVVPLLILRYTLAGFFDARRDRGRLEGLFRATLETNASMGSDPAEVRKTLTDSAQDLLRCESSALVERSSAEGGEVAVPASNASQLRAKLRLPGGEAWLTVSGRSRHEPFDQADQSLLDALGAVGTGALSNATLYQQSRRQRQRLAAITSSLGEGVIAISPQGRATLVNRAAASMLGWDPSEELGGERLLTGHDAGIAAPSFLVDLARPAIERGETVTTYDTPFLRSDQTVVDVACTVAPIVEDGQACGAVLAFRDISGEKELTLKLRDQALHDPLTGLPNRRRFLEQLNAALERSTRSGSRHAVLFCDIDRFKLINDSLGHHAGDQLLAAIAGRIASVLAPGDVLARFGGDEFTVLLERIGLLEEATGVAQRILDAMSEPVLLGEGRQVVACLSIGVALTTATSTGDDVLHDADVAMYEAKTSGRSGAYCVFDSGAMGVRSAERIELELQLRQALERDELEVHYQPLFSVFDRRVVGAEALVRWHHPTRGLLAPGAFIPLAEETGLILPLGKLVLEMACADAVRWRRTLGVDFQIGVNLSARQFQYAALLEEVHSTIEQSGVDPGQLCFEITESLAMHHVDRTNEILHGLKALGASVAIDDFGTGHSALGYLAQFPIDIVKIDRSFVDRVELDPVKSAIISAVLTMAGAVGSTTVVEGVETESELEHLRGLGCQVVQGYLLARPMPRDELEELMRVSRSRPAVLDGMRDAVRQPA